MNKEEFHDFLKLIRRMISLQQYPIKGDKKTLARVIAIELNIDNQLQRYTSSQEQFYPWQIQFMKTLMECRAAQQKYWAQQISYNLHLAKTAANKLNTKLEWVENQLPDLITPKVSQATLL